MYLSVFFYTASVVLVLFSAWIFRNRYFSFIPIAIIIFIFGLRVDVGTDYQNYVDIYQRIYLGDTYFLQEKLEPIFYYFTLIFTKLGTGSEVYILFTVLFTYVMLWLTSKKINLNYFIFIYSFIIFGFLFSFNNIVKQGISIVLVLYAFISFSNDKIIIKYLLILAVASFIHYSALIGVFLIFFYFYPVLSFLALAASLFSFSFFIDIVFASGYVPNNLHGYFMNIEKNVQGGLGMRPVFEVLIFLILFIYLFLIRGFYKHKEVLLYFSVTFSGVLLNCMLIDYGYFIRLANYFYIFIIIFFSIVVFYLSAYEKFFLYAFLLLYGSMLFYRNITSEQYLPYSNVFLGVF
ncbi:EpsG family protein [Thiomicrospira pelophila]|uniref:EpsG family protein n=1 Tax=Thiomicrospira pelophila TaxID=934 RepID=UPI0004A7495F|nr:EpsG family protein [Thiomicrospira pelophila]